MEYRLCKEKPFSYPKKCETVVTAIQEWEVHRIHGESFAKIYGQIAQIHRMFSVRQQVPLI